MDFAFLNRGSFLATTGYQKVAKTYVSRHSFSIHLCRFFLFCFVSLISLVAVGLVSFFLLCVADVADVCVCVYVSRLSLLR